jgi:hypothetical protein
MEPYSHYKGELLLTVLHESLHIGLNIDHPFIGPGQAFTSPPWSYLNGQGAGVTPSVCVKW